MRKSEVFMKKYLWIFFVLIIVGGIAIFTFSNNNQEENYEAKRTGTNISNIQTEQTDIINLIIEPEENMVEEQIAEFTTRLPNDTEARDGNIKLACKTLNGTVVKIGEEFSLWDIIGCPSAETGYEKAKSFTSDGEVIQSYGGGICQLSTTIYNAVLEVEGLKVTERHEHSREVPYIKDGKDAAVSYGNSDLKFKNNLNYDVRIDAEVKNRKVKITLIRIS